MDIGEDRNRSFGVFRNIYTEVNKMVNEKWYDSSVFFVQGSAWKIGVKITTVDKIRYLGLFLRRYCTMDDVTFRHQEYYAEVEMRLISQYPDIDNFKREYQQIFNGGKKSNYGWPEFKPLHEVLQTKNGFIKNDCFIVEVHLAASPPVFHYREKKTSKRSKHHFPRNEGDGKSSSRRKCCFCLTRHHITEECPSQEVLKLSPTDSLCSISSLKTTTSGTESEESELDEDANELDVKSLTGTTMEQRAQSILDTGLGSDCEFLISKDGYNVKSFKASKIFLTRASPVFEKIFFANSSPKSFNEMTDVDSDAFEVMLKYVYNCNWEFKSRSHAMEVYYVADKYMIKELKVECVKFLWPTDITNIWDPLQLSTHFCERALQAATMKLICENTKSMLFHSAFTRISHASLIAILEQNYLQIDSEIDVFNAVKNWAAARCKEKHIPEDGIHLRSEIGCAIKYIRLLTLTPHEFIGQPMESGILTTEESVFLLRCINNKEKFLPCPHLSSLRKPRNKKDF